MEPGDDELRRKFSAAVNMSAAELTRWLKTPESRRVGLVRPGARESVGWRAGHETARILRTRPEALGPADLDHMRRTIGFIARHRAQRPLGDISRTRWRFALMNWGCDPMKDDPI